MSTPMEWSVMIAFVFAIFTFGGALMMYLVQTFDSRESVRIDTAEEALEKKVFDDDIRNSLFLSLELRMAFIAFSNSSQGNEIWLFFQ